MQVIRNFGRNVRITPKVRYSPHSDDEVLDILRRHRGERIRCRGALHSWSRIVEAPAVLLDMRHFDSVGVVTKEDGKHLDGAKVRLGAGCTIKRALDLLEPHGLTLPTLGAITKQTIAGAISSGTHGSGMPSLSHFVEEVRLARYDPSTNEPVLVRLCGRDELLAARCALGGLGVILDVVLRARPNYCIEEQCRALPTDEEARAGRNEWPLQQFILMPWQWRYYVFRRRCSKEKKPPKPWQALKRRLVQFWWIDLAQHAGLKAALFLGERVKRLFLRIAKVPEYDRIDYSRHVLTLRHDLFCHVEMEVFVPEDTLPKAMQAVQAFIELAAGQPGKYPALEQELEARFADLRGLWTHHYAVSFRYVLQDDTLISMASPRTGAHEQTWVAISFFNYGWPTDRRFARFAEAIADYFVGEYEARLHWGKYFPRDFQESLERYPGFQRFENVRRDYDRAGVFWIENL